ncbi:uncharacterized transposon-derived protein F54H12.3 [Trichonephila clavipes]|nr:uncharacterized transposon-derived protein F54H12.3 [Trichonephila clavipes]
MHQDLAAFYENPEVPNSFGGVEALHRSVKGKYSKKDVKHWLSQKDAYTLHKPVRHKFQQNRVFVSDIDRQFQADLVDMQSLAEFNKGVRKQIVMASKRKHSTLTLKDKLEVLKRLDKGEGVTKLATEFNVGKATICDWRKNRKKLEQYCANSSGETLFFWRNIHRFSSLKL